MTPLFPDPLARDSTGGPSGPIWTEKGKAKELVSNTAPPAWYAGADTDEAKAEGSWWSILGKDEAYVGGLPPAPAMVQFPEEPIHQTRSSTRKKSLPNGNGVASPDRPPSLVPSKPVSLERVVHRTVDKLFDTRKLATQISEFQKAEVEGLILPPYDDGEQDRLLQREEASERKRKKRTEREEAAKRRRVGGEVGEREAALKLKKASAAMLAHVGFEGAFCLNSS